MSTSNNNENIIAGAGQSTRVSPGEMFIGKIARILVDKGGTISQLTEEVFDQNTKSMIEINVLDENESPDYGQYLRGQNILSKDLEQGCLLVPRRGYFSSVQADSATLQLYLFVPIEESKRIK